MEIKDYLNNIRKLMKIDRQYVTAIDMCTECLQLVTSDKYKEERCILHHNIAICYKNINDIELSIKHTIISLNLSEEYTHRRITNLWLLATLYEEQNNISQSIQIYLSCAKEYRILQDNTYRLCVLFNIARLKNNINTMIKIVKMLEMINTNSEFDKIDNINFIIEMYAEILSFYKNDGKDRIENVLNNITDISVRQIVQDKIANKISA